MLFIYINLHTNFDLHLAIKNSIDYVFSSPTTEINNAVKNIGWFNEDMPKGLVKSKKKGEYVWTQDQSIMVYVPSGNFWRGFQKGKEDERPEKLIYLSAFYIDKYELNNERYKKFIISKKYSYPSYWKNQNLNKDNQPVVGISWDDANEYAKWSKKVMPTEAQWEKAARGAITIPNITNDEEAITIVSNDFPQRIYPWGEEMSKNFANIGKKKTTYTYPVSSYLNGRSPYGCHNMLGNVWEWCLDSYNPDYYNKSSSRDPVENSDSELKICRGGAWLSNSIFTYTRQSVQVKEKKIFLGVRFVIPGKENVK